jgi:hypothetical protein
LEHDSPLHESVAAGADREPDSSQPDCIPNTSNLRIAEGILGSLRRLTRSYPDTEQGGHS